MKRAVATRGRQIIATLFFVAIFCTNGAFAQSTPIPGAIGTFDRDLITGNIRILADSNEIDARLVLVGTLVPGVNVNVCAVPQYSYPVGMEFHLKLYRNDVWFEAIAYAYVSPSNGEFVVEAPLLEATYPHEPVWAIGGSFAYKLYVGYDPDIVGMCVQTVTPPVVTITAAAIVVSSVVSAESTSWGLVKCLYR